MQFLSEALILLDSRSFASPWFWLVFFAAWSLAGRSVLGVPSDVLSRAGRALREDAASTPAEAAMLLDWLRLNIPRMRIGRRGGAVLTGLSCFGLTLLALLGFGYGLEMAQALSLILIPMALLFALRLRLAHHLRWVLEAAHLGQPAREAAAQALRRINRYRTVHAVISVLSVMATALWASLWLLTHPNGL
ncbi:hypothetical protein SAMN05421538_105117 [Paracoccus isoporae]|uniref:Component of SufBCD complex n=1 Tax=Paracoccus isoporae TaxID=591205 RepID=A0A1G7BJP9_9RHOB|nr:hypothetical protein [Paracoccus isoporae]SDE27213.1 hypothetical protein SAMN05421538_105117 [Paracoccus isoporae]